MTIFGEVPYLSQQALKEHNLILLQNKVEGCALQVFTLSIWMTIDLER